MSVQVLRAHPRTVTPSDGETTEVPKLRACAYARISTDSDQQESSYEAQCTHYTNMINEDPTLSFAGLYADEGISGTRTAKLEKLMWCTQRAFPVLPVIPLTA